MHRPLRTNADVSPSGPLQGREDVVGSGIAIEEIEAPAGEDFPDVGLAVQDLRSRGELLQ